MYVKPIIRILRYLKRNHNQISQVHIMCAKPILMQVSNQIRINVVSFNLCIIVMLDTSNNTGNTL